MYRNYFPNERLKRTNFSTSYVLLKLLLILMYFALKQSNTPQIARITENQSYNTTYNEIANKKNTDIILTMGISLGNVPFIKMQKKFFASHEE